MKKLLMIAVIACACMGCCKKAATEEGNACCHENVECTHECCKADSAHHCCKADSTAACCQADSAHHCCKAAEVAE